MGLNESLCVGGGSHTGLDDTGTVHAGLLEVAKVAASSDHGVLDTNRGLFLYELNFLIVWESIPLTPTSRPF